MGSPLSATVKVRYTVGVDGRVSGCTVTGSSGRPDVDSTTCRLIEERFYYRPAKDAEGRAVPQVVNSVWSWEPR
jgi:protein TonB